GDDERLKEIGTRIELDPQKSKDYLNSDDLMQEAER
ncbi:MAG: ferredoxin-type protein NapG, partial [Campylobacter sp.]|nr:ferredoxin-type protein NapG [Campylobacter sp.]